MFCMVEGECNYEHTKFLPSGPEFNEAGYLQCMSELWCIAELTDMDYDYCMGTYKCYYDTYG